MNTVTLHITEETAINVYDEDGDCLLAVLKVAPTDAPTFYVCKPTDVETSIGAMRIVEEERGESGRLHRLFLTLDA